MLDDDKVYCMCGDPDYMHWDEGKLWCLEESCSCPKFDKAIFKSNKLIFEDGNIYKLAERKENAIKSMTDDGFSKDKVRVYFLPGYMDEKEYSLIVTGLKRDE